MFGWLTATGDDIAALWASWGSVRGGWRAARRDARELLAHRRLLIDTQAMTPQGMRVVLRTRLRLIGDTQTDILRGWLESSSPEAVRALAETHFQTVTAALGGWAAALGMERMLARLVGACGGIAAAASTVQEMLATERALLLHAILTDWRLLGGLGVLVLGVPIRWLLRRRVRAIFRSGLGAPARAPHASA